NTVNVLLPVPPAGDQDTPELRVGQTDGLDWFVPFFGDLEGTRLTGTATINAAMDGPCNVGGGGGGGGLFGGILNFVGGLTRAALNLASCIATKVTPFTIPNPIGPPPPIYVPVGWHLGVGFVNLVIPPIFVGLGWGGPLITTVLLPPPDPMMPP